MPKKNSQSTKTDHIPRPTSALEASKEQEERHERALSVVEDYAGELDELRELEKATGARLPKQSSDAWRKDYPYDKKLSREAYEEEKRQL